MKNGYTTIELLAALAGLASLALAGVAVYAIIHFISKFW